MPPSTASLGPLPPGLPEPWLKGLAELQAKHLDIIDALDKGVEAQLSAGAKSLLQAMTNQLGDGAKTLSINQLLTQSKPWTQLLGSQFAGVAKAMDKAAETMGREATLFYNANGVAIDPSSDNLARLEAVRRTNLAPISQASATASKQLRTGLRKLLAGTATTADLEATIVKATKLPTAQARAAAISGAMAFTRTVNDVIADEAGLKTFIYTGPIIEHSRPFCRQIKAANKGWTRDEISKLDNGQTGAGTVATYGGGYRCIHGWVPIIPVGGAPTPKLPKVKAPKPAPLPAPAPAPVVTPPSPAVAAPTPTPKPTAAPAPAPAVAAAATATPTKKQAKPKKPKFVPPAPYPSLAAPTAPPKTTITSGERDALVVARAHTASVGKNHITFLDSTGTQKIVAASTSTMAAMPTPADIAKASTFDRLTIVRSQADDYVWTQNDVKRFGQTLNFGKSHLVMPGGRVWSVERPPSVKLGVTEAAKINARAQELLSLYGFHPSTKNFSTAERDNLAVRTAMEEAGLIVSYYDLTDTDKLLPTFKSPPQAELNAAKSTASTPSPAVSSPSPSYGGSFGVPGYASSMTWSEKLATYTPVTNAAGARVPQTAAEGLAWGQAKYEAWQKTMDPGTKGRTALASYSGSGYVPINNSLRARAKDPTAKLEKVKTINDLQDAIQASGGIPEDIVTWRGQSDVSHFTPGLTLADLEGQIGKVWTDHGFMSTTTQPIYTKGSGYGYGSAAFSFAGSGPRRVLLDITLPKGVQAAYLGRISSVSSEDEMLLGRGTQFEVMAIDRTSVPGYVVVKVRAVVNPPKPHIK